MIEEVTLTITKNQARIVVASLEQTVIKLENELNRIELIKSAGEKERAFIKEYLKSTKDLYRLIDKQVFPQS